MRAILHGETARLDYCVLAEVTPLGRALGRYAGTEFTEAVADEWGRKLTFAGIAPRTADGRYARAALREREFIVQPGLIYRYD